jgi:hypothetical protein
MLPSLSALPIGQPGKRARGDGDQVVEQAEEEYLFGYYHVITGDSSTNVHGMDQNGQFNRLLPTRDEVLQQLNGTHPQFNFVTYCDWQSGRENFIEYVESDKAFAVLATREKEVVGMFTVYKGKSLGEWIQAVQKYWTDAISEREDGMSDQDLAVLAVRRDYEFDIDYACTGGGDYSSRKLRGVMGYMLYCMSLVIDRFFVRPAATIAFVDQWERMQSQQMSVDKMRKICYFTLGALEEAQPSWQALGFDDLYEKDRETEGTKTYYRPVFDRDGSIPQPKGLRPA